MTNDNEILYDEVEKKKWKEELSVHRVWNKRHLYALFAAFGTPSTMLDVGCGLGDLVDVARRMQIDAWGVDQLVDDEYDENWFIHHDLRKSFSLAEAGGAPIVNLVTCWEVAEHIPPEYTSIFCNTLASHVERDESSILVFTSAHPGQEGTEHINVHPATFWRDRFHERGLNYQKEKTRQIALLWSNIDSPLWWLASNVQVFSR